MDSLFYLLNFAAVSTILFAWYKITRLKKRIPGGIVKATCNVLSQFIGLFTIGFLALPLFPQLPEASKELLVNVVFISAAAFSIIVINFFSRLAADNGF